MASSLKLESSPSLPLPVPATQREDRLRVRVSTQGHCRGFLLILILRLGVGGRVYKRYAHWFPFYFLTLSFYPIVNRGKGLEVELGKKHPKFPLMNSGIGI